MNDLTDNLYAVSQSLMHSHRAGTQIWRCLFRMLQLSIFQCTFMAFVLYPPADHGFDFTVRTFRSLLVEWGEAPVGGLILFFFGPAILYLVARSITVERHFRESWLRFMFMGAIAFQAYFIVGSRMLDFATAYLGTEHWKLLVPRIVVTVVCISITLASEIALATATRFAFRGLSRTSRSR